MLKTRLLTMLVLAFPYFVNASVIYSFSESFVPGKTVGFTYKTSDYLDYPNGQYIKIPASSLTSCDMSGMPAGWDCSAAIFRQAQYSNGLPNVTVTLAMVFTPDPTDAFSTDQVYDSFTGATLTANGIYHGMNGATFSVVDTPGDAAAAPEPASYLLVLVAGLALAGWCKSRGRRPFSSVRY